MASVNIDSKFVRKKNSFDSRLIDVLELENGCVCCSLADDMLTSIRQFIHISDSENFHYDHILLECSGIAEPSRLIELFRDITENPESDLATVKLDTLVTIIDAKVFFDLFGTENSLQEYPNLVTKKPVYDDANEDEEGYTGVRTDNSDHLEQSAAMRSVTDLLLEQVEYADVIVINKIDLLQDEKEDLRKLIELVSAINPAARIEFCSYGAVSSPLRVLGSARGQGAAALDMLKDLKRSVISATSKEYYGDNEHTDLGTDTTYVHKHDDLETTAARRFGLTSVVYLRRKPFHPQRLKSFFLSLGEVSFEGVNSFSKLDKTEANLPSLAGCSLLRSKGFLWVANSSNYGYYLSHAGKYIDISVLGSWWDSLDKSEWPTKDSSVTAILQDFDGIDGDRRQEIIFIGQFESLEVKQALCDRLDSCLLSDSELKCYRKAVLTDDSETELGFLFDEDSDDSLLSVES